VILNATGGLKGISSDLQLSPSKCSSVVPISHAAHIALYAVSVLTDISDNRNQSTSNT
jgi:hypothetical protein